MDIAGNSAHRFGGSTGIHTYDAIAWSARPLLVAYDTGDLPIQAVRHIGSETRSSVQAASTRREKIWDALLLSNASPGYSEARVCGELTSLPIIHDLVYYLPAHADTLLEFPPSAGSLGLHMRPGYLDSFLDEDRGDRIPPMVERAPPRIPELMRLIERELTRPSFDAQLFIDSLFRALAIALWEHDHRSFPVAPRRISISTPRLKRVTQYVEENIANPIRLTTMAQIADLSIFHFSRAFKLAVGLSPYNYVRARRIAHAQILLARGDLSIVDVALCCGFASAWS